MRKMFLCTLVVFGFMNFCVGQATTKSECISVKKFDAKGLLLEQFKLKGNEALTFDIPKYILDNDHVDRLVINGSIKTDVSSTIIKFDSNKKENEDADYICKEVETKLVPFLGVATTGRDDLNGVDINKVIPGASAALAGITTNESILELDDEVINSYCNLMMAVSATEIGDRVELKMKKGSTEYSRFAVMGSKGVKTITYQYCEDEPLEFIAENNINVSTEEVSFNTYPNPTRSFSHINFESGSQEDVIFSVKDVTGSVVHKEVFSNFGGSLRLDYNLGNDSDGTYILSIQQGKEMYNRKVQVIK